MNSVGAAIFTALPSSRSVSLLRGLIAFQVALDLLDALTEPPQRADQQAAYDLHRALRDAVDLDSDPTDYYARFPGDGDGGYLASLVSTCRATCRALPGYIDVQPALRRAASDLSVQVLNHVAHKSERDRGLRLWATARTDTATDLLWFELPAAASSTLGIYALLAAATDPNVARRDVAAIDAAYHPWICLACTMMDSLVDEAQDRAEGAHSYVGHYENSERAACRVRQVVQRAVDEARQLRRGDRHAIIVTGMIAMYLGTATESYPEILEELGWVAAIEVPVTRLMRSALGGRRQTTTRRAGALFRKPG